MVTMLEPLRLHPKELIPVNPAPVKEPAPPPILTQQAGQRHEWGYSMPCAGVRYYTFRPAEPRRPASAPMAGGPGQLIDEWAILL